MAAARLGQALGFVKLTASLLGGAVILWMFYPALFMILDEAKAQAPGGYGGLEANQWLRTGAEQLPTVFLLLAFFGYVSLAVFQRRYA